MTAKPEGMGGLLPLEGRESYVNRRLREGGLRLVSGSPTMLSDEFARFEAERALNTRTSPPPGDMNDD